ncbi:MAG TPA: tetratricopeptide repeat protein [Terriglobales bacterium]|nr:tetratricopeptide repeat protein [Terriglobales bacterium]
MIGQTISHYRVREQIGAGGMGVVYRAYDERLEREVALKVLRPGLLTDEAARRRFRKEALALARLNHPNVATIFEFGNEGGTDFLVTEYIPGVTLDARLAAGALDLQEAIRLATQFATGLAAAHEQGLIHRDLKPGNLRVTPDGRLKILDFGLAQLVAQASEFGATETLTRVQEVAGTLPYMAPEQLRLGTADRRSDLWAAGAVLHEMVTGKRPFEAPTSPVLIDAILNGSPTPPSKINRQVPSGMDHIILKALEKDPSRRYQTASDLRVDLERLTAGVPVSAAPKRFKARIAAVAVLLLVVVAGAGYWFSKRIGRGRSQIRTRRSVAVLGFKNLGGNSGQAWLSTALSEMLTTELAAGEKLRTVPGENVARAKSDLDLPDAETLGTQTLEKISRILGADLVVLGSYLDLNGQVRVDARVQDADAGTTLAEFSESGTEAQMFELVRRLGETLRDKCGAGQVTPEEAESIRASQPVAPDAAELYAQGLAKMRSFDVTAARDLLSKAVDKDPKYALAHEALAAAWSQLGYDEKARQEAHRAYELSGGLPRKEALQIEARFQEESHDWAKAVEIYRSLWTVFPDDPEFGLRLANAQVSAGQGQDALATIGQLRKLPSPERDDPRIDLAEAAAANSLSDYRRDAAAAEAAISKSKQRGSQELEAEGLLRECWALRNLGDPERAKATGQAAGEILGRTGDLRGQARSLTCVGNVLGDQGQLADALKMHEQALALARKIGAQKDIAGALINLGNVQASQQSLDESTRQYKLALELANSIGDKGDVLLAQDNIGANLALEGDFPGARKSFEDSVKTANEIGDQAGVVEALLNLGSMSYVQGDLQGAKRDYEQSLAKASDLGFKSRVALASAGVGDVYRAQGDLRAAEENYQKSLGIHQELGENGGVASTRVSLAMVALENGQAAQAESLARQAVQEFRSENDADQGTAAEDVLAQALMAEQKFDAAQAEITAARKLGARDRQVSISLDITGAELLIRTGKNAAAARELQKIVKRASELHVAEQEWRARLALAQAQLKLGQTDSAHANLQEVKTAAGKSGFQLLVRKAEELEKGAAH